MQNALRAAETLADEADIASWLHAGDDSPACADNGRELALRYLLDDAPETHGGLLQALTLATAAHAGLRLRRDGRLYRQGHAAGHIRLELLPHKNGSLARIRAPQYAGLAAKLFAVLNDWNVRPYLPLANRWDDCALDGSIDQKGRALHIISGKPQFQD